MHVVEIPENAIDNIIDHLYQLGAAASEMSASAPDPTSEDFFRGKAEAFRSASDLVARATRPYINIVAKTKEDDAFIERQEDRREKEEYRNEINQ